MWDLGTRLVHTALFHQISLFFFFLQTAQEPTGEVREKGGEGRGRGRQRGRKKREGGGRNRGKNGGGKRKVRERIRKEKEGRPEGREVMGEEREKSSRETISLSYLASIH